MIKTYEEACTKLGLNPNNLPDVSTFPEEDQKSIIAYSALTKIAKALNEGWKPNWNDSNEYKYYPYFDMRSGSFDGTNCVIWGSISAVGSRLCFKNRELAEYAGKQFEDIYKEYLTIK
jgi:hypothetical protein